ncbi:Molybdenum cofactor sulfurase [Zostera marina]|uniref:Molybdenum cofactor sulfurase n=1 Tax=Zostera marina TaxID=29655 RepID=A0A0K9P758_ZOSMR|nr:Molybdenum cofactor sulfurase [Zostera marina]
MEGAKGAFLRLYGEDYGYPNSPKNIDQIRALEFKRLEGTVYLDHAGATLYSEAQMEAVAKDLTSNIYGNPHSQSESSMAASEMIRAAREQVLEFCNASSKDYRCVFTSGATSSLKLVGEIFPWSKESCYMYTTENHNSVLGIREYALEKGAGALAVDVKMPESHTDTSGSCNFTLDISLHKEQRRFNEFGSFSDIASENSCHHLFAFPSECNFSGTKYQLELANLVKKDMGKVLKGSGHYRYSRGHWMVLIDAAKGCATQPPDLSKFPADFIVLSFYKIFGYPTGLGALIVRNDAARLLKKNYFSGGTVSASIADIDFVKRRESIEQLLEDGTVSFLSIASIKHGFQIINRLTISAISRHTRSLASYVRNTMEKLRHENGPYLCEIYGSSCDELGPMISFNLRRLDGLWFGYREVEKLASLSGIQLRTGCFCNPGACAKYLGLSHSELLSNIEDGHVCWDDHDILNGKPTGAIRISFGYMSTFEDAELFLQFTKTNFLSKTSGKFRKIIEKNHDNDNSERMLITQIPFLKSIFLYPIKSCSGFSVECWPLHDNGLLYDREWLLRSSSGEILTQKKVPEMIQVLTFIDLRQQVLLLESPNCQIKLQISLQSHGFVNEELVLYGQRYEVEGYSADVNAWFSKAIGRNCSLLRCCSTKDNSIRESSSCRVENRKLNFANQAQLLLISTDSLSDLNIRLKSDEDELKRSGKTMCVDSSRFRPNLVVSAVGEPYAEDGWQSLKIGKTCFTSLGGCNRCQIINLDPWNAHAEKSNEPLATLASFRRVKGKILFGILLRYEKQTTKDLNQEKEEETWVEVGQKINVLSYNN